MTPARSLKPLSFLQPFSTLYANFNTIDKMVSQDTAFLVFAILNLATANVDPAKLLVRMCCQ